MGWTVASYRALKRRRPPKAALCRQNLLMKNKFILKSPKMIRYKAEALRREVLIMTAVEDHITTEVVT